MAKKDIRLRPQGEVNQGDVLHPETNAGVVLETENKKFVTPAQIIEIGKIANKTDKTYVDNKVKTDVPLGAKFTDTTYTAGEGIEISTENIVNATAQDVPNLTLTELTLGDYTLSYNSGALDFKKGNIVQARLYNGVLHTPKIEEIEEEKLVDYEIIDNRYVYVGMLEYVTVPKSINGETVTSYQKLFSAKETEYYSFFPTNLKGVYLTDNTINNMSYMFQNSQAKTLDLSNFDTSNVTDMQNMFWGSQTEILDLSNFDTSKVGLMNGMFSYSEATTIDVSNFDTSNATSMNNMFEDTKVTTLDLSSFDTSNVTNMNSMFWGSEATIGYARTQADADKFNASSRKPVGLNFIVKP